MFAKVDGFIRIYDETRYFTYNIWYIISLKRGITYIFPHYFAKIKVASYDTLSI